MNMLEPNFHASVRSKTLFNLRGFGLEIPGHLPLLDSHISKRNIDEVTERILALNVVVATAYGFPKDQALDWLSDFGSRGWLSKKELEFLLSDDPSSFEVSKYRWKVEALWALGWLSGVVHDFNPM